MTTTGDTLADQADPKRLWKRSRLGIYEPLPPAHLQDRKKKKKKKKLTGRTIIDPKAVVTDTK